MLSAQGAVLEREADRAVAVQRHGGESQQDVGSAGHEDGDEGQTGGLGDLEAHVALQVEGTAQAKIDQAGKKQVEYEDEPSLGTKPLLAHNGEVDDQVEECEEDEGYHGRAQPHLGVLVARLVGRRAALVHFEILFLGDKRDEQKM